MFSFLKKLLFEEVEVDNQSKDYTSEAIIISCFYNPMKSPYRLKAFNKFYEGIKGYNHKIVECIIGDGKPELPDNIEKVYTSSLLWHKETLLNNIIKKLPAKYKYIFWLDADIIFTNPNWLEESVKVMKDGANMVQPFEYGIHLEKDWLLPNFNVNVYRNLCNNPVTRHKSLWRSFCANNVTGLSSNINYDVHGHVGFAWGIKREIWDKIPGGLYDKALVGGADHIMAHAAAGHINHNCITKSFTDDLESIETYSRAFHSAVEGKLGFASGDVLHIWHGDLKDRQYLKRVREFTPKAKKIHQRDSNGFYVTEDADDSNYMLQYFMLREIMDDVDAPQDFINDGNYQDDTIPDSPGFGGFGGGQSDGGGAGGSWEDNNSQQMTDDQLPGFIPNSSNDSSNNNNTTDDGYIGSSFS